MQALGNRTEDSVIDFKWSTNDGDGASITRATNGTISIYKGNSTTQSTAGVTDTEDFDSLTGVHHCRVDTSADAFYEPGYDYQVVLSGATIDGQVVNAVLASFTIELGFEEVDVVKWLGTAAATPTVAGVPEVDVTLVEGSDATNQIRDSVVDDSTRIDASALNTLSGHDPGATLGTATSANQTTILSKLLKYFQLSLRKDAAIATDNATELTAINADGGSGAGGFANTTDAQEAIRDNMGTAQTGDAYAVVNSGTHGNAALKTLIDAVDDFLDTEIAAILAAVDTEIAAILADTAELQTDWADGGRLDLLIDSILSRFTGMTSLTQWLGMIAGKQTGNSTARTEIRATGAGGGTFLETTDSLEAVRDRGDAAWTTGAGGAAGSGANTVTLVIEDGSSNGLADTEVWVTTTDDPDTMVAAGTLETDGNGEVTFMLDDGDYYAWRQKTGYNFTNPQEFTVSGSGSETFTDGVAATAATGYITLTQGRTILRNSVLHVGGSSYENDKLDDAILACCNEFARETNCTIETVSLAFAAGEALKSMTSLGVSRWEADQFLSAHLASTLAQLEHVSYETIRRRRQADDSPGTPAKIAPADANQIIIHPKAAAAVTISLRRRQPFVSFTAGMATPDSVLLNIPIEWVRQVLWTGGKFYLLGGAPGHPDAADAGRRFDALIESAKAHFADGRPGTTDRGASPSLTRGPRQLPGRPGAEGRLA